MLGYISTSPLHNPLFLPINSRFATHPVGISEPYEASPDKGELHQLSSSIYQASGCHVFASFLACLPLLRNDDLPPKEISRSRPIQPQHLSVIHKARA